MKQKQSSRKAAAESRIRELLEKMTLEEKVGQLAQPFGWTCYTRREDGTVELTESFKRRAAEGGVGSLYGTLRADPWTGVTLETGLSPEEGAKLVNEMQAYALEHGRHGIPILFGEECSHGHMAIGATVFPVPLSVGSTWNPDLYREMCRATALETRSQGGAATYSPVLDVVRDPRWGRTEECYGEDPYLTSVLGTAAIEGLQGDDLGSDDSILATLKHFAAYGSSEGGRNSAPVHMGPRELHEIDLLPFRHAVEAGARSVMTAYNEIDGVPCTTNRYLLQDILRDEWGFDGFVITDCGALGLLTAGQNTAEDGEDASAQAVLAGVDMEMSGEMFDRHLLAAVRGGRLSEADVDRAVRRVLELKFELNLFERPFTDPSRARDVIGSEEHRRLARRLAAEGIVLLKNDAGILPLDRAAFGGGSADGQSGSGGNGSARRESGRTGGGRIAVIGPNADAHYNQLGDYTSPQPEGAIATVLDGVRAALGESGERVLYAPGCRIRGESREGFPAALECAKQADTIVLVLGGSSARDFGEGTIDLKTGASVVTENSWNDMECGEGIDRSTLNLAGVQLELAREIFKLGKPVIVVYINGRPIAEPWIVENAHAILEAWYPGQEGGHAIADILFGGVNPSGRLTLGIPKHVGQLPVYHYKRRTRGKRYLEDDFEAQYPFGFGLSYTEFKYDHIRLDTAEIQADGTASVSVDITNTGGMAGEEVVQLYVSDLAASVVRPEKMLKGFRKIKLAPGETQTATFAIGREQLEFVGPDLLWRVEPGRFNLRVGPNSVEGLSAELTVLQSDPVEV
ncbi:glycoside hydrolase family 3 N-terminal domain-containing protein [Saccharibacillus sp. CPCC 101409]|uniref:glycoside hydrolase family 3 N-terminal domain-containing protein n=1 Tax=Saccharibacillus sp. CPCC 101409 TaxID=3058041 RepID=UPI002672E1EC|nr:glycoside hydrolase family 3 N-terminal domain-containing protein [Saccharibacillus sp. CPCC 101409]MDO3413172.1 glycoside hydrolase family 3 N-terminal domain-containing protein [Saccharibacillus sp. CPCC 101409]